jgi:uncharacterized protein with PQ loop repeat
VFFCCSIAWCSDTHATNMILFFYCSIAWCSDTHVTNMILFFCCSIAWFCCYRYWVPIKLQKHRNDLTEITVLQWKGKLCWWNGYQNTTPYYNERANYVGQMGIRTPCYTTMKEQNYVCLNCIFYCSIAWCSDTHVTNMILLFCCSIAWCSDTYVINIILFFCCSIAWFCCRTPCYTTMKEQNYVCREL